jgi:hypothetical protein
MTYDVDRWDAKRRTFSVVGKKGSKRVLCFREAPVPSMTRLVQADLVEIDRAFREKRRKLRRTTDVHKVDEKVVGINYIVTPCSVAEINWNENVYLGNGNIAFILDRCHWKVTAF